VLVVSRREPHNVAIAVLFVLLSGVTLLTMAPFELGTIRLAGVSLLWWYGVGVVPAVAVATVAMMLLRVHARAAARDPASSPAAPDIE
jgi:hypothetical protein